MQKLYLQEEFFTCIFPIRYARCHIFKGACSRTYCNSNWANKIHQLPLEKWIKKSLQWTPIGRRNFLHMFNTTTHWWWHNQSASSSVHSKTTNYERRCLLQWFIPIYLHTAIVDIVYWQYNWNFSPLNTIPWLRIFLTWSVYLICIANYSKVKLQVDHLFLKG